MFDFIRSRKPYIHTQWFVPLLSFKSNTEALYKALEDDLKLRDVPDLALERVEFREGWWFSANRVYLRLRRRHDVLDVCSAAFGTGWWFSLRYATLPHGLKDWEKIVVALGLVGFFGCYWHLFGVATAAILMGSNLIMVLLIFLRARTSSSLDEFLIYLPVIGSIYESRFRADSYYRQDQDLVYGHTAAGMVRAKVVEMCAMGGVDDPKFIDVYNPRQILKPKDIARYFSGTTPPSV